MSKRYTILNLTTTASLGTQLFQVASAYGVSQVHTNGNLLIQQHCYKLSPYTKTIFRKCKHVFHRKEWIHYNDNKVPHIFLDGNNGFFQSEQYFDIFRDQILSLYDTDVQRQKYLTMKYLPHCLQYSCFVYVTPDTDPVQYKKSLKMLCNVYGEKFKYLYVFIRSGKECDTVDLQGYFNETNGWGRYIIFVQEKDELNRLYLMSMCWLGGIVVPEDDFSWWGAYLNTNKAKKIINVEFLKGKRV